VDRRKFIAAAGSAAVLASAAQAFARMGGALLDHGEPGVGLTVTGPVRELRLYFNQSVLVAASNVQVRNSAGVAIPTTRPVGDPSSEQIVIVRFGRVLPPGTYRVSWHVVSIDQVPASGAYRFTVS
jgi:methionine-rich copper-binding protein CopC